MRRYLLLSVLVILSFILVYIVVNKPSHTQITYTNSTVSSTPQVITEQLKTPIKEPIITPVKEINKPQVIINHPVPFMVQAPTGDWEDERQQDGCEEASALMAMYWIQEKSLLSQEALTKILAISDYEQKTYGEYRDINLSDVKNWIFKDYFNYNNIELQVNIKDTDIIKQLIAGHIILLPMNGQKLHNPYFTSPGPERHMIVIRGYDPETDEFITNDPGTKRGEGFRYSVNTIMNAILVYPTGYHLPANENIKSMLVIKK